MLSCYSVNQVLSCTFAVCSLCTYTVMARCGCLLDSRPHTPPGISQLFIRDSNQDKSTGVVHQAANPTEGQPSAAAAVAHPTVQSRTPTSQRAAAAAVGGAGAGAAGVEGGSGSSRSERLESHGRTVSIGSNWGGGGSGSSGAPHQNR